MKNFKISAKLMVSFGIVVLLTLAMGILSIFFASNTEQNYKTLVLRDTAALNNLGDARSALRGERSELRAMMINSLRGDPAGIKTALEKYQNNKVTMKKNMDEYYAGLQTEAGRNFYDAFYKEHDEYAVNAEAFVNAVGAADNAQLYALLQKSVESLEEALASIDDMTKAKFQNSGETTAEVGREAAMGIKLTVGILILVALISVVLAIHISALVTKPLALMLDLLKQVGETGNLTFSDEQMHGIKKEAAFKDEIAQSIAAFVRMMEQFTYYGKCLSAVAARDLTVKVNTLSDKDTCGVALKDMLTNLNSMFREINMSASQVAAGSSQIAQASTNLATGAGQQAATIQEFTATVSEIHRMADENTKMATNVLRDVQESGRMMNDCTTEMERMLRAMQDIDEKSQRIANVIKVIDDIAFQTNILALNAAVEAARAGQHGKGFAVVSDEVRNLASKSAGAAKETAALIESSLHSVADGNTIVTKVSDSLQSVGAISDKNAASIEHLYEGSTQQSTSMAEINTAITQLSSVVQANSATAEETAASSEEMSAQSAVLNEIVSRFKLHRDAPETAASSQYAGGYAAPAESRPEDVISFADSNDKY